MTLKKIKTPPHLTVPVSVRLTREERDQLKAVAGKLSVSEYIRSRLFSDNFENLDGEERLSPQVRQRILAQILMRLGQSGLAKNLSELSDIARLGLLELSPEIQSLLSELLTEVRGLRRDLLKALGIRPGKDGGQ